jgi:hypothetical protein
VCLISGVLWQTKNELSDVIGELTGTNCGADGPRTRVAHAAKELEARRLRDPRRRCRCT